MTARLSKLGTSVTVIFMIISLITLVVDLFFSLLCRRRRSHNASSQSSPDTSSAFSFFSSISSKRLLLYFLKIKDSSSTIEPKPIPLPNQLNSTVSPAPDDETEVEVIDDVLKLHMYCPSRILFTIKEEDREVDLESDNSNSNSVCSSAADEGTEKCSKRVISLLDDGFNLKPDDRETLSEIEIDVVDSPEGIKFSVAAGEIEIIPFSTPCGSPLYFTPTASPTRERSTK